MFAPEARPLVKERWEYSGPCNVPEQRWQDNSVDFVTGLPES